MYFSVVELNRRRRGTQMLLSSPGKLHGAVMDAFPREAIAGRRVLWRVDHLSDRTLLYVVSPVRPSFEHIQEQAGWQHAESWKIRSYQPLLDSLQVGNRYAFRLAANPTHTVTFPDGRKKKIGHVTAKQQLQWLLDRAETIGVKFPQLEESVPAVRVIRRDHHQFRKQHHKVTLRTAVFEGALEVCDPDRLRQALTTGIGRGKAYGAGLLTLAPLADS
ncbi:type I-E CRISPR-associated protein Cas6/Cse3/CasE [Corynebacterium choanae]|uniref:CRISPR-associated endoribonuclease Cse3 n=1 Tax=Corynebacterium choanae TaxID=1862358 RepID=A0A3G6J965_9CORY|nr:type I-E CRISPR-associated protein Cas6/Cse3/CasE [Corynebacterium choanae]AZA12564.1 CRISPR-associated endoribonuclease Cse3 [Corynebacterium choanae]